jgi:hypothetical protein
VVDCGLSGIPCKVLVGKGVSFLPVSEALSLIGEIGVGETYCNG